MQGFLAMAPAAVELQCQSKVHAASKVRSSNQQDRNLTLSWRAARKMIPHATTSPLNLTHSVDLKLQVRTKFHSDRVIHPQKRNSNTVQQQRQAWIIKANVQLTQTCHWPNSRHAAAGQTQDLLAVQGQQDSSAQTCVGAPHAG